MPITQECIYELNHAIPISDYLTPSPKYPKEYACPFCGSPHHVKIYESQNDATCMKCRKSFDLISAVQAKEGIDFPEAAKEIAEKADIRIIYEGGFAPGSENFNQFRKRLEERINEDYIKDPPERKPNTPGKYGEDLKKWATDIDQAKDYLHACGLSDDTIKEYGLGYKLQYFHKAGKELPAVTFRYSNDYSYYSAHAVNEHYFYKPNANEAGEEPIYNPEALQLDGPCYVTEGQLDALAIIEAGAPAIALCGHGYSNLLPEIKDRKEPLILFFDQDPPDEDGKRPGPEAQAALAAELQQRGIPCREAVFNLAKYSGPKKDAKDLLQSNPEQFRKDISANYFAVQDPTGIEDFLFSTSTTKYKPIPTGLDSVDRLLKGGFTAGTLVLLGSPPGGGKTTLAAQIFESMAESGSEAIFFNLEMSKEQLLARSMAKRVFINNNHYRLTALDILQGYKLSESATHLVQEAAKEYRDKIGTRLLYNPDNIGSDLDDIIRYITKAGDKAQREGRPAPNICIDYLHLLTGEPGEDVAATIKRAMYELKNYAKTYDAIVFAIIAQNREANRAKHSTLEAGRDSSGLEYGADLILQLYRPEGAAPDEVNLAVTKSRFSETNTTGYTFKLYGGQSFMEPVQKKPASTPYKDN